MFLRMIYDEDLAAASYLIGCQRTGEAIIIDPERDIDRYLLLAGSEGLKITAVTETHIHADFLSGTREIAEQTGAKVYLSDEGGAEWSYAWLDKKISGGTYAHELIKDGSVIKVGNIEIKAVHTPGHTPEHLCFLVTDKGSGATEPIGIATGDFLFVGDIGRPDLLETAANQVGAAGKSAHVLFRSMQRLESLPDFLQVWPGHGAGSACGKALGAVPTSTMGYERRFNPAILAASGEREFIDYVLSGQPEPPLYFARMKRDNKAGPRVLGALPEPKQLALADLEQQGLRGATVIDTRNWESFRSGHIPGSLFHPFNRSFVTNVGSFVGDDPELYIICKEGQLDGIVRNLVRIGLDRVLGWADSSEFGRYQDRGGKVAQIVEETVAVVRERVAAKSVHVLDVRRASEFSEGHISGAQNIAHTRLAAKLGEIPKEKTLVVHCRSGVRSAASCALLRREGFDVINLHGGFMEWERSGAPTES